MVQGMTRQRLSTLHLAAIWSGLGTLLFLAVLAWQHQAERSRFSADGGVVELRRGADGHYHWPGRINGRAVDFLVDTGATSTAIPASLAQDLQLPSLGRVQSQTAGGLAEGQRVVADVQLHGGVQADRLRIVALPGLHGRPLLGMDVLGRLRLVQADGVLRIDLRTSAAP